MTRIVCFLPALVLATAFGCSGGSSSSAGGPLPASEELTGAKVVDVNGFTVGTKAVDDAARRKEPADGAAYSAAERTELANLAVDDELLFQEAFRRGMYNDPKVRKIMTSLMLRQEVYEKVTNEQFTDAQIQAAFDARRDDYIVPEKVQVRVIYVEITPERDSDAAKARAAAAYAKAKATPDAFREIAEEYSDGEYAKRGGEVGFIDRGSNRTGLAPELTDRAFDMDAGAISEPVLVGNGWWVMQVPNKRERIERTLEQVRGSVLRRLKTEEYEKLTQGILVGLRSNAKVTIDEAALTAWAPTDAGKPIRPSMQALPGGVQDPNPERDNAAVEQAHQE